MQAYLRYYSNRMMDRIFGQRVNGEKLKIPKRYERMKFERVNFKKGF